MKARITLFSIVVLVTVNGCGTKDEGSVVGAPVQPTDAPSVTATTAPPPVAIVESTTLAPATTTAPVVTAAPEVTVVSDTSPPGANPFGGNSPEDFLMPAVICLNLQEAQDEIQDHGVFLSRSEDATGNDRMQLNDSNWQVVAQYPDPGTPIGEGEAVLSVVKYGEEPNPC